FLILDRFVLQISVPSRFAPLLITLVSALGQEWIGSHSEVGEICVLSVARCEILIKATSGRLSNYLSHGMAAPRMTSLQSDESVASCDIGTVPGAVATGRPIETPTLQGARSLPLPVPYQCRMVRFSGKIACLAPKLPIL